MILDLPQHLVTFSKLQVTVSLCRVGGHLAVCIDQFSGQADWKSLQQSIDWNDPPPELVFQAQAVQHRLPSGATETFYAGSPSNMDAKLAQPLEAPPPLQEEPLPQHGHRGAHGHHDQRDLRDDSPGHASTPTMSGTATPAASSHGANGACMKRWQWNEHQKVWVERANKNFDTSLLTSRPPLPSSSNTVPEPLEQRPASASLRRSTGATSKIASCRSNRPRRTSGRQSTSETEPDAWRLLNNNQSDTYLWDEGSD